MKPHTVYRDGFYRSESWDYAVRCLLGRASRGGSEPGEVLATVARVEEGDHAGWFSAWHDLGCHLATVGDAATARGHRTSAARAFLRSANYLAAALESIDQLPSAEALVPTFRTHRLVWEAFVATSRWSIEEVEIPYEDSTMPGWHFHPDEARPPAPTLVVVNGSDGTLSGLWCEIAEAALERGYGVLLFDGPGQQSMLFERGVPFRPDWEAVLTPVVEHLQGRDDVDPERLALYGVSQGGYWATRAMAFEHRFAAAVLDGGVVDVSASWRKEIPAPILRLYERGERAKFERAMELGMRLPGGRRTEAVWNFRARPYGADGYAGTLDAVSQHDAADVAGRVRTPTLILSPDREQFFPGQSEELSGMIEGSDFMPFSDAEGASFHCQPMARELTAQRTLDWLDERLAPRRGRTSRAGGGAAEGRG
ncbi:alpha/beta hydrolase family protein [Rothia halotolerans]|uniref:alpha/beta hydrolase family protein n=1 Tax=Rothia halotolerans TaxID=405770 RepID=UPI00101C849C|nr:prolyl oligopeptidase family serine peptidase [Rothia halotolerans]